jgi:hypothetical protein
MGEIKERREREMEGEREKEREGEIIGLDNYWRVGVKE